MKKFVWLVLCFIIVGGLNGCGHSTQANIYEKSPSTSTAVPVEPSTTTTKEESSIEKFMVENGASLYAKEVEFDMKHHLGKNFFVYGIAELSNYYNYGFDGVIEDNFFCIRLRPMMDTSKNDWYLYCDRSSFNKLYDKLIAEDNVYISVVANISPGTYEDGQGNMAFAETIGW